MRRVTLLAAFCWLLSGTVARAQVGPCSPIGPNPSGIQFRTDFNGYMSGTRPMAPALVGAIAGRCAQWGQAGQIVPAAGGCKPGPTPSAIPTPASAPVGVPNTLIPSFFNNINAWLNGGQGIKPAITGAVAGHGIYFSTSGILTDAGIYPLTTASPTAAPTIVSGYIPVPGQLESDLPSIRANVNKRLCGPDPILPAFMGAGKPGNCVAFASDGSPSDAGNPCVYATPSITPTPTPSPTPTPPPTPTPGPTATPSAHLSIVGPNGSSSPLHSDSFCASLGDQPNYTEAAPWNVNDGTGWNYNTVLIGSNPAYYTSNSGNCIAVPSYLNNVTGGYTGNTQAILRWTACKWGEDEDHVYAESDEESGWHQNCSVIFGGSTCQAGGDCNNPDVNSGGETANLSLTVNGKNWPVTNGSSAFIGTTSYGGNNGFGVNCSGSYASWGIIQSKVNTCEWYAWPMIETSTAWSSDYRWAKWRACMNGAAGFVSRFNTSDYTNAVSAATSNPNGTSSGAHVGLISGISGIGTITNMKYLDYGCIATHCGGGWYDTTGCTAHQYISTFVSALNNHAWPGGIP